MDLKFYIDRANAASQLSVVVPFEWPQEPIERERFLKGVAEELRSSLFFRHTKGGIVLAEPTVMNFVAGQFYLKTLRRVAMIYDRDTDQRIDFPMFAPIYSGVLKPTGKLERSTTPLFGYVHEFLKDLESFDCGLIRQCKCKRCQKIFQGRRNGKYCNDACRQAQWSYDNPESYSDIQARHEEKRTGRRVKKT